MPFLSVPAKIFSMNVFALIDSGISGAEVSYGSVYCLGPDPENLVEMNITLLKGVEKKYRRKFFSIPIKARNSLVSLLDLVADNLF